MNYRIGCKEHRAIRTLLLVAFASAIAFVAPALLAVAAPAAVTVDIVKFAFVPQEITVVAGTTVVWTNHDETPHTVTSSDKSFTSKGMDTDDTFKHVFAQPGDFGYICTLHPFMTGVVHVRKP